MLETLKTIFMWQPFIPHGHCYLWNPGLVALHLVSDSIIALAYYSIPITLLYFVRKRQDLPFSWIFLLFSSFIVACGTTHLMEIWTLWHPTYWLSGCIKAITAFVSFLTALEMLPLIPKALALPSPAQLQAANQELEREIAERKRAEEELRWKETLLRSMTNASPLAFYVVDNRSDNILYFNHDFCKIWGIEHLEERMQRGELKNSEIIPDCLPALADVPAFAESCKPLQREENTAVVEDEIAFRDGRTIRRFSTQIRDESDRYFGRLYLFEDVTERKFIEEKLQLADFSLERSALALAWIDRNGKILRVNEAACRQRGYSREELVSMYVWDSDPNFPREVWPQHWQELKTQKTLSFTSQHRSRDGNITPVEITLNYLEFNGKEYNFACARDISDRYRAEEALRASQARLSGVLDIADEAIISVDSSQRITLYNQGAERIFGYTSEEMLGKSLDQLLPERFAASHHRHVEEFAKTAQTARKMGKRGEIAGRRKDGSEFPAEASISQLELAGEKVFTVFLRDITERKQAEELRSQLAAIVESSDDAIISKSLDGIILSWNAAAERLFGYSAAEIITQPISLLIPPDYLEEEQQFLEQLQRGERIEHYETVRRRKDGTLFDVSLTVSPIKDTAGRVIGASKIARDITERKQAEAALRESEARFQAFMDNSPAAAWITNENGKILYASQCYYRLFNVPANYSPGKVDLTIHPAEFRKEYLKNIRQVVETNQAVEAIELASRPDGTIGQFLVYKFPVPSSSAQILVGGVAIDITDHKKAEAALQQREQEFRALVENAPDIIMRLDRQCRYLYINPTVERQAGIPSATLIGKTINEFGASEALVNLWQTAIQQVFETGNEQTIEYEIPSITGQIFYYVSRLVPEFGHDGSVQSVLAIARDISDRQAALRERQVAEAALKQAHDELEIRVKERTAQLAKANKKLLREISDRQQAQAALEASEARLKEVLDNTAAFISSARICPDKAWKYDYYSPNGEEIFGYKGEEFAADPNLWVSRIPAEDIESIVQPIMADLYAGQQITIEYRFRHKNGSLRWLSNTLLAKKHKSADYWFATGIVIDITERKLAEKALQESEQRFATLAAAAPVGIFRTDIQGNYVYGNERCFEMIGLSPEQCKIGAGWATTIHPDDYERTIAAWLSFLQEGIPYCCEHRFQRANGSIIWVLGEAIAEKDADGNVIGYIGTLTDITERKEAEKLLKNYNQVLEIQVQERMVALSKMNTYLELEIAERKEIEAQLRRSEAKLSAILDNAGACIYIKDLNGTYIYVNRLTAELFGRSESEIIGANDRNFFPEELATAYRENSDLVIKTGVVHSFEEVGIDRFGALHYYLSTKVPLKNSAGEIYAICGISADITQIKNAEAAVRQSEERMQALLRAIPDLMFRHRVDGTYLDVAGNDSALLVPREILIGKKLQDTPIPEQVKTDLLERFQIAAETGTLQIYEHDLEKPDGMHSYETRIMKSSADEVVCLVRDITERKQAQAALKESEERYRTVIAAMAEGIVLQDADGVIRTCNNSAKRILGLSRKQMMGRTSLDPAWRAIREDGSPFPGEEHPAMVTLRTGKPCSNVVMGVHKPDGSFTWISINSQPLFRAGAPLPYAVVASFADITARKQAEEAMRQSEARYLAILEDQTELIGRALPDGTLTFVNEAFCRFYGMTREELVGQRYEPKVFEEDREYVTSLIKTLSVDNPLVVIENRVIAKGQEVRWTQWINRGIFNEDGQLLEFQGVGRDITDRKLAEAALKESEEKFRAIFNQTFQFVGLLQPDGILLEANQSALDFSGITREQVVGKPVWEAKWWQISSETQEQLKSTIARAANGEFIRYEVDILGDSRIGTIDFSARPMRDESGRVKLIIVEGRDITERKQMEETLRESEAMLSSIFDNAGAYIFIKDLESRYTYANRPILELFKCSKEEIIGADNSKFFDAETTQRLRESDLQVINSGEVWQSQEVSIVQHSGEQRYYWAVKVPLKRADGSIYALCGLSTDITELKQTEEALRHSESTLRSFFNSGSMLMGIVELYDNDILHLSDNLSAARFFNTTPEQMKNRFASEMGVPAAHLQQWIEHYREALHTQAAVRFEYVHQTPTEQKWLSASVCPIGTGPTKRPRLSYIVEDISERKRAEEALQLSESRLQHLTASIPGTLYSFGYYPDGSAKFEYVSAGCRELFEIEPEKVLEDRNLLENQVAPEDRPKFEAAIVDAIQNMQPLTSEWRNLTPSGKQKWVRVQAQLEHREDGSKVWHGVILDITDRKFAEEKLKQAEHKYRTLVEQIPGVVYISPIAATTEQGYISPQLQQLLEISPEEWSPGFFNSWADYVHPEDRERVWQAVTTTILTGEPLSVEYRMITCSGKTIWIRDRANLVLSAGESAKVLQGLAFDISDRKQMEQALQESNERFQLAASAVKGFIYDWDLKRNIVLRTQGLFEAVGYHPEEAEAKVDWWNEHVHPEDLPKLSQDLSEAFATKTQNYYVLEYRLRHRDNHYVYLSDYGTIARDADGQAIRAVGHAIDVSDRREAEAALQKALQAAQAASIAKSRFLSNMSHELRTPLNAILGFSQVMVRSSSLSADHKEQLKIINRSGEHLLNLINDILSMAKIEAGQSSLNENRFDLYLLLDDLEQMLNFKAASKGLQLIFERAPNIPQYVQTDENKLRQILINLLGNAVKFTSAGYVALRVKRSEVLQSKVQGAEESPGKNLQQKTGLLFEVEDTGLGIAANEIGSLFAPFVQTETGRKSMEGTGLGLTLSRQFVQMMGGDISVRSQVAKGTTFTFDVFVKEVEGADAKGLSITRRVIGLEPNQPPYRMLIVEDVEENRQLLLKLLEPLGFEVREAVNGEEAIALWSTWKPHLIWMDMRMPVMDGYEATLKIKALEKHSSPAGSAPESPTKIVALTASAFEEEQGKILAAGCDDFIHKPFRESLLFNKIAQHLGVRYIYEEDEESNLPQLVAPRPLTPEDLSVMSPQWIAQLHQAILCADESLILQLIEQIPQTEASLAVTLRELLNNFRLDLLFDLTQEFHHES